MADTPRRLSATPEILMTWLGDAEAFPQPILIK